MDQPSHLTRGVLFLVAAFFVGTVQNSLIKFVGQSIPVVAIIFIQYLICLLVLTPNLLKNQEKIIKRSNSMLLLVRGLAGVGYFFCMFYALKYSPLVDVALMTNTAPLWVPLICLIVYRNPIEKGLYLTLFLGFLGVTLLLLPSQGLISKGSSIALLGGIFMAISIVSVRQLAQTESSKRIMFYYFFVASACLLIPALVSWKPPSYTEWLFLLANGLLMLLQQSLLNYGFRWGSATKLSVATYSAVLFSALADWLLWGTLIGPISIIGAALIIASGCKVVFSRPAVCREKEKPLLSMKL